MRRSRSLSTPIALFSMPRRLVELSSLDQHVFLAIRLVDQPVLPLAGLAFLGADRRVERGVAARRRFIEITSSSARRAGSRSGDLIGPQVALVERLDLALDLAQVEEQPLLVGGGAHLHQAPRAQDVFLDRGLDPPHRIGGEAEAALRVEALDRLHQADIAFRDHFADRQAVAAIAHGDLGDEPKVAGDQRCAASRSSCSRNAWPACILPAAPASGTAGSPRDSGETAFARSDAREIDLGHVSRPHGMPGRFTREAGV